MSKDKNNKKNINNKTNDSSENIQKEPMSKFEKIFVISICSIAAILLLIVIIGSIGTGGDKNIIARKYTSIDSDNVFELLKFDEFKEKINNKEDFQLLIINNNQTDANYYIYCVDDIVKTLNKEYNKDEVIYVLDPAYLKDDDISFLRMELDLEKTIYQEPNLIMFKYDEKVLSNINHSVDRNSTDRYDITKYQNNSFSLLVKYFTDCYKQEAE